MSNEKIKRYNLKRIAENAKTLSESETFDCYMYSGLSEEQNGTFNEILEEISELTSILPDSILPEDLDDIYLGNSNTKVFGRASCNATQGHLLLEKNAPNKVMFSDKETATHSCYRPCAKCMPKEYAEWKAECEEAKFQQNYWEGYEQGFYQ